MSEEEKIKRAKEVSQRRQNRIPASNINQNRNKRLSSFDKLFLQVIASICIFGVCYFINQNNIFAMDKIKEAFNTDTDFQSVYFEINNVAKNFMKNDIEESKNTEEKNNNEEQEKTQENQNKSNENTNSEENIIEPPVEQNEENTGVGGGNEGTKESIDLDDVSFIKNTTSFIKPVQGFITSPYGEREPTDIISANHQGVDIGANMGTDIVASMEGYVEEALDFGDYGKHIKIVNGEISTLYAHCSELIVKQGEYVNQGQVIAKVGQSGKATGPHLHFEIRRNNVTVNPQDIVEI